MSAELRGARGERARLVDRHGDHAREVLEGLPTLDQHALAGRPADRRDDSDGDRDHQRARTGNDQQRERPVKPGVHAATERNRHEEHGERGDEHQRRVDAREAVDEALRRSLRALGLLDERDDARQGGLARGELLVRTVSAPWAFSVPANTVLSGCLSTGTDSPVIGASSTLEAPATTRPSSGGARRVGRGADADRDLLDRDPMFVSSSSGRSPARARAPSARRSAPVRSKA